MSYYTTDVYEIKREILSYCTKISKNLPKPTSNFVLDMQFGMARRASVLTTEIARGLDEGVKLKNTSERLCDNMENMTEDEIETIKNNYYSIIRNNVFIDKKDKVVVLFDDSEIAKPYGRKFEDMCLVRDASQPKTTLVNGYHICEAVALSSKNKQPIPLYSYIYSTDSTGYKSMPDETIKSLDAMKTILDHPISGIFDRGFDSNTFYKYFSEHPDDDFVIRLKLNRKVTVKGRDVLVSELAKRRKGKVNMTLFFESGNKDVKLSHTRVGLPCIEGSEKAYTLIFCYGLSEAEPLLLITNRQVDCKGDVITIVREYFYRWRIEENFRHTKEEYDWENMRVRTLKKINVLNLMLMIRVGHVALLANKVDECLLSIKIIERSRSIRTDVCVWIYQITRGMKEALAYAQNGIQHFKKTQRRKPSRQIEIWEFF